MQNMTSFPVFRCEMFEMEISFPLSQELAVYLLFVILHITSFIVSMVDESDPYGALVAFRVSRCLILQHTVLYTMPKSYAQC